MLRGRLVACEFEVGSEDGGGEVRMVVVIGCGGGVGIGVRG